MMILAKEGNDGRSIYVYGMFVYSFSSKKIVFRQ